MMDPNCIPVHARAYTVPRSLEHKLQLRRENSRLVDIGVLEEDHSSEGYSKFPKTAIVYNNETVRIVTNFRKLNLFFETSPISYSKDRGI
jgi:hypothetical protein